MRRPRPNLLPRRSPADLAAPTWRAGRLQLRAVALAAAALPLAAATPASAATVKVIDVSAKGMYQFSYVELTAAPGEANRVSVTSAAAEPAPGGFAQTRWTVKDTGAPVSADYGCLQVDPNTATCTIRFSQDPVLRLGDGDDELTADTSVSVFGDAGDDTIRLVSPTGDPGTPKAAATGYLFGGDGDDLLDGSIAGRVSLDGGKGGDLLIGSDFDDILLGGPGTDELRGADGLDTLKPGTGPDKITCGLGSGDDVELDLSDRLLDPDTPTLGLPGLRSALGADDANAAASARRDANAARAQTGGNSAEAAEHAELKTDCEMVSLPAGKGHAADFDLTTGGQRLKDGVLSLGKRLGAARSYDVQLRTTSGKLLGTGSLRSKTVRVRLTAAGLKALAPGARRTVRLVSLPRGSKGPVSKSKPGVQVDLTVGTQ